MAVVNRVKCAAVNPYPHNPSASKPRIDTTGREKNPEPVFQNLSAYICVNLRLICCSIFYHGQPLAFPYHASQAYGTKPFGSTVASGSSRARAGCRHGKTVSADPAGWLCLVRAECKIRQAAAAVGRRFTRLERRGADRARRPGGLPVCASQNDRERASECTAVT